MKRALITATLLLVFFGVAIGGIAWSVHNYRECRRFGHSWLYCEAQR
ncbi:MAG TPA: hypothetical protein VNZ05_05655 [Solirubrobacteraceae bacterium]|jgi:hypothetical protein|nr:hypothetical protein [Solirubrobacteraceae bacterium]